MKRISLLFLLAVTMARPLLAQYQVGTCNGFAGFATISAAVSSPTVPANSTINICPGTYPEQVIITKPLSLVGIQSGNRRDITILGQPTYSTILNYQGTLSEPVVLVEASPVNFANINVSFFAQPAQLSGAPVGIFYASGASGTVVHSNVWVYTGSNLFPQTAGIWIENADIDLDTVMVSNNTIDTDSIGIWAASVQQPGFAPVLAVTLNANQFYHQATWGIGIDQATATIQSNVMDSTGGGVYQSSVAIDLNTSAYALVTANKIINFDYGVAITQSKPTITNNTFWTTTYGIEFNCYAATVTGNTFYGQRGGTTALSNPPLAFSGANTYYNIGSISQTTCP